LRCALGTPLAAQDVAASYAVGALGGFAYLRLLSKSVDAMGADGVGASAGGMASQPRLLIPIILGLGYNRFNQLYSAQLGVTLELLPMLVGFFTYKLAVITRQYKVRCAGGRHGQGAGGWCRGAAEAGARRAGRRGRRLAWRMLVEAQARRRMPVRPAAGRVRRQAVRRAGCEELLSGHVSCAAELGEERTALNCMPYPRLVASVNWLAVGTGCELCESWALRGPGEACGLRGAKPSFFWTCAKRHSATLCAGKHTMAFAFGSIKEGSHKRQHPGDDEPPARAKVRSPRISSAFWAPGCTKQRSYRTHWTPMDPRLRMRRMRSVSRGAWAP
jgi:hypothetical protein